MSRALHRIAALRVNKSHPGSLSPMQDMTHYMAGCYSLGVERDSAVIARLQLVERC